MDIKFEFVDSTPNGAKRWKIKAISVTTTRNKRKYNQQEMQLGARSLSFRPLNRNHDSTRELPFPENQTEVMDFNPKTMAVEGTMLIKDPNVNKLIESGRINKLSIEQIPTKGESCSSSTHVCEQNGVVFTGMALLDYDVMPGDPNTEIKSESVTLYDLPIMECVTECCKNEADKSLDWPLITLEKDAKLTVDDISSTYDSMNDSQKAHIIDPNDYYPNTKKFVKKGFKDLNDDQQTALIKTYGFRHSYNDVKHLLGKDDQEAPNNPVFDNNLLGKEKDIQAATDALIKKGVKDPIAQSMSNQDPNNKTENNSLNAQTQNEVVMSTPAIRATKHTKEWIDNLAKKMIEGKFPLKEIDSMITAFVGMQNDKAPLSDKLASVLYNASDEDLDQYARVTSDQEPSVIPSGGLADYKAMTYEMIKALKDMQTENSKSLKEMNDNWIASTKKIESTGTPSSQVSDPQYQAKQESLTKMYEYYDLKGHPELRDMKNFEYKLDVLEYMNKYSGRTSSGAGQPDPLKKGETVTVSAGDMGQTFAKQVMLLPGGRMRVPVRQYCNFTEIPNGADRANWYTIGSFVFTTVTEGTEPTNVAQTVTKIQALPSLRGAVQRVGYSQVENAPFGLVDAINNAMVLAGLHDEALDLLGTGGSYWGTTSNVTNWVNGNSGADIVSQNDDIAGQTLTRVGLIAGKERISKGGYDTSPGNLVLFCHPKAYQDLMTDTNLNTYYQYARPDITATYVLEQLYGIDIVPTTAVAAGANTTNNTWRNTLAVKGWALGIAAAREITIEVERRNEVQQLIVSGMHRVKSAVIDYSASCGISSAQ